MAERQTDDRILHSIQALVDEEHALYGKGELDDAGAVRLEEIRVKLDQCWDLLRQRRALREFGGDPDKAKARPPKIVENYEQ